MIGRREFFFVVATLSLSPLVSGQNIPAFPGADGAGAAATGGRNGIVYHVTKLDRNFSHNEPGTLRYGLTDSNFNVGGQLQPRTIVFDVAGTFWLGRFGAEENHHNGWDTASRYNLGSNITVAGQTAPGPVYIMGGLIKAGGNNAILRNVTIAPGYGMRTFEKPDEDPPELPAPGDFPDAYVYDALDITGTNILIDHVSTFYATDETISANEQANFVTVQYSNISQGQNYPQADAEASGVTYTGHALGSLLQGGSNSKFSIHHNLYTHQKGRLPRVGSEVGTGAYNDFRNNVFYNWLGTAGSGANGQPSFNNFVGNYWRAGPGGDDPQGGSSTKIVARQGGTGIFNGANSTGTRVYHAGNFKDTNKNGTAEFVAHLANSDFESSSLQPAPFWSQGEPIYRGVTDTAESAYDRVLRYMGARWWDRDYDYTVGNTGAIDTVDERLVHETASGTGKIKAWADDPFNSDPNEGAEWRHLLSFRAETATGAAPFNRPADWDIDRDGMPDVWEKAHGLNPNTSDNNGDFDADGYTNLEEYINEIAAWPAPQPIGFHGATSNRYAEITNWNINWQPSKYDEVTIATGVAVVDAVGQHAGTLVIGPGDGDAAELNVTDGWLMVDEGVVIGGAPTASGRLRLSGGKVFAPMLEKGNMGEFHFTGGTLRAGTIDFDLVNRGGTLATTSFPGITTINGDLQINGGALQIELSSPVDSDRFVVNGTATLGGALQLYANGFAPKPDDVLTIITAKALSGQFINVNSEGRVYAANGGGSFLITVGTTQVTLSQFESNPAGDFNDDGVVDAADYVVWRRNLNTMNSLPNDTIGGLIRIAQYDLWRANFGSMGAGTMLGSENVPEPSAWIWLAPFLFRAAPRQFSREVNDRTNNRSAYACDQAETPCNYE